MHLYRLVTGIGVWKWRTTSVEQFHCTSVSGLEMAISFIAYLVWAEQLMKQIMRLRGGDLRVGYQDEIFMISSLLFLIENTDALPKPY